MTDTLLKLRSFFNHIPNSVLKRPLRGTRRNYWNESCNIPTTDHAMKLFFSELQKILEIYINAPAKVLMCEGKETSLMDHVHINFRY